MPAIHIHYFVGTAMKRGSPLNRILDYYLGIPLLRFVCLVHRKKRWPKQIRRIGILVNPALGDTLLCSGPIVDIRRAFPQASLLLFAAPSNVSAAKLIPSIDRIEMISVTNPAKAIRVMRASSLDLLIDFTSWQRITAAISAYSGAKFVVGYYTPTQHRHFGYDRTVEHRSDRHELENHRALAASFGATAKSTPQLTFSPEDFPKLPIDANDLIVFHVWPSGTRGWLREWPRQRWVELAKALNKPARIFIITSAPDDEARSLELRQLLIDQGLAAHVFVGKNGLSSVANLLTRAKLLVSVNTGIMHLGAIIGTSTVGINGPNAQRRWGPVGPRAIGIDTPDGSGGFLHLGFEFDGNPTDTMERISTQQVLDAASNLLNENREGTS
jgi:ADP-heptose:LPS heptosyltransferase